MLFFTNDFVPKMHLCSKEGISTQVYLLNFQQYFSISVESYYICARKGVNPIPRGTRCPPFCYQKSMVDQAFVRQIVEEKLAELDLFLVDLKIDTANKIDIAIDGDSGVGIDQCIAVSRAVEGSLDREKEDFELLVASPGIGHPFKVHRQYTKAIGRLVEVQLLDGTKVAGTLSEVTPEDFEVTFSRKEQIEGTKKKQVVEVKQRIAFTDTKSTKETISFK